MSYSMQYEMRPAVKPDKKDENDPAARSYRAWKRSQSKPSRTPDGRTVSTIVFDDPDWWRCQLALEREKLAKLGGA